MRGVAGDLRPLVLPRRERDGVDGTGTSSGSKSASSASASRLVSANDNPAPSSTVDNAGDAPGRTAMLSERVGATSWLADGCPGDGDGGGPVYDVVGENSARSGDTSESSLTVRSRCRGHDANDGEDESGVGGNADDEAESGSSR